MNLGIYVNQLPEAKQEIILGEVELYFIEAEGLTGEDLEIVVENARDSRLNDLEQVVNLDEVL